MAKTCLHTRLNIKVSSHPKLNLVYISQWWGVIYIRCLVEMHQYCLLNSACYIINTHTDMIWQGYQRQKEIEKEWSECIFHEVQSSPAKVLDMTFQSQRGKKKGGREKKRRCCMATNLGMQLPSCVHISVRTSGVGLWSTMRFPLSYQIWVPFKKLQI